MVAKKLDKRSITTFNSYHKMVQQNQDFFNVDQFMLLQARLLKWIGTYLPGSLSYVKHKVHT